MPSRFDLYKVDNNTDFSANFWNSVFADVDTRVSATEDYGTELDEAISNLNQVGLDRINLVLTPALQSVLNTQRLGFLLADSVTPNQVSVGNIFSFAVTGDQQATFTPAPFMVLTRKANYTDYAIARTIQYDSVHGTYTCTVLAVFGAIANSSISDWTIVGSAGVSLAEQQILTATQASQAAALVSQNAAASSATSASGSATSANTSATDASGSASAAATSAANAHTSELNAATSASQAAASAASISSGPVASVNGHGGVVTLAAADVGAADQVLSNLSNTKTARGNLGGSKRYGYGDANQTIPNDARVVGTTAVLTAPRTFTLPPANSFNGGERLTFCDEAGGMSATNTLTLLCAGSDLINGAGSQTFSSTYSEILLESDGVSRWTYDIQGVARGGTGSTTAAGARANLGAAASGANSDITSLTGLTSAFPVSAGGTGGTTAAAARYQLQVSSRTRSLFLSLIP